MVTESRCGADDLGNAVYDNLSQSVVFDLPDVDFTDPKFTTPDFSLNEIFKNISKITNEDLTTKEVDGDGTFDVLMTTHRNHIGAEYDKGRITGEQYTKAYIELTTAALGSSIQFLLGKEQAYWQSVIAQQQAKQAEIALVTANIQLETAKYEFIISKAQLEKLKSDIAINKMQLANLDVEYCTKEEVRKQQVFTTTTLQPLQQRTATADAVSKEYQNTTILPSQNELIKEQTEVQRAQTLNNRKDGTVITGSVGKQKDLYSQQIDSYKRDTEYKVAKMYLDSWITQKTIDEGLLVPSSFTNAKIDEVFTKVRTNSNLT